MLHIKRLYIILFCALLPIQKPLQALNDQLTVYFYNPESSAASFAMLKTEFDTYLTGFGNFRFQPFGDRNMFIQVAKSQPNGVFILSSFDYRHLNQDNSLVPVLIGIFDNKTTYRKILIGKSQSSSINPQKKTRIASCGSKEHNLATIHEMLNLPSYSANIDILIVPKDLDALMSVIFGMSSNALVSENSFKQLAKTNPHQYEMLAIQFESKPIQLPIVSVTKNAQINYTDLLAIIEKMDHSNEGEKKLKLLGVDGWRKISDSDMKMLEGR